MVACPPLLPVESIIRIKVFCFPSPPLFCPATTFSDTYKIDFLLDHIRGEAVFCHSVLYTSGDMPIYLRSFSHILTEVLPLPSISIYDHSWSSHDIHGPTHLFHLHYLKSLLMLCCGWPIFWAIECHWVNHLFLY